MLLDASHDDMRLRTAQMLWQKGHTEETRLLLSEILAHQPAHVEAANLLAKVLQSQGQLDGASAVMAASCRHLGSDADTTLRCAQFIRQSQRQRLAAQLCEEAFARGTASADLHALAGNIYRELGDFDAARFHFLAALEAGINLDVWFVLGALAATQRYSGLDHADVTRLATHFRDVRSSARARAATGFGLAKIHDDVGEYAAAANVLREANALARDAQGWSRKSWEDWVTSRIGQPASRIQLQAAAGFVPIFIVGLPRSGTTLTALQLAKDANVRDRGELPYVPYIAERLQASGRGQDRDVLREAADLYCAHLRQDDAPARWYVDNNQMNFRYLDLIASLFPHARVIHCVRGRRDTALSIWSQHFANNDCAFANDLGDIAAFAESHDRLMRHWKQTLDLPIHTVVYEELVEHPDAVTERLQRFVGLPGSGAEREPKARDQIITSASMWQARQPIYRSSIARWRAYTQHVPELEQLFAEPEAEVGSNRGLS